VLPTLWFSREFGLVFFEVAGFLKTCGLLVFGLVLTEICLFFGLVFADFCFLIAFSSNFMAILCFNFLQKAYCACFCENLVILDLFFRIATLLFYLNYLLIFLFVAFSCQRMLGLFFGQITCFWFVFHIFLLVFAK